MRLPDGHLVLISHEAVLRRRPSGTIGDMQLTLSKVSTRNKSHFGVKDFKCDRCGSEFTSVAKLNWHYTIHEGATYGQGN